MNDTKRAIFITGKPGSGKSTLIKMVIQEISKEFSVGGIFTPEIRKGYKRKGFKVIDISTGKEDVFAHVNFNTPYRVGKYSVDLARFDAVAVPALMYAKKNSDLIVIDEIGKMELISKNFRSALESILNSEKPLLATVNLSLRKKFFRIGKIYYLTRENFDLTREIVISSIENVLKGKKRN